MPSSAWMCPTSFSRLSSWKRTARDFRKAGGWGYAVFNYDAASDKFTADEKSLAGCGHSCHVAMKAKDYHLRTRQSNSA